HGDLVLVGDDVGGDEAGEDAVVGHGWSSSAAGAASTAGSSATAVAAAAGAAPARGRGALCSTPCCSNSLRAMSLGRAPLLIQSRTRSASICTFAGLAMGS